MRRATVAGIVSLGVVCHAGRRAAASSVEEFPDNGSEQEGRGGAWVARASDPLAAFYNPAGLAGQPTRVSVQSNFSRQHTCFTRVKAAGDPTVDGVAVAGAYPQVCNDAGFFPDPQVGFTWHVTDRLGLGLLLLSPSAVGNVTWPSFVGGAPAPQRYLLIKSNVIFLTPTIAAGWEVVDRLRIGGSFQFGTAPTLDFINAAVGLQKSFNYVPSNNDVRTELTAHDSFVPGFTLGTMWSPVDELDVAAWYKWSAPVDAKGDAQTVYPYFRPSVAMGDMTGLTYGDTSIPNCNNPMNPPNTCGSGNNASVRVPIPMEAKLGVRYHLAAGGTVDEHLRDPIAQDLFDVELDFTWANNSAFDNVQVRFPAKDSFGDGLLPANPAIPGQIPANADVRHHLRDVFGARLGGDFNAIPDMLAFRAGGFFETKAADSVYQNIDFDAAERFGVAAGATYRLKIGSTAFDFMAAYGHVFFGTLNNTDPSGAGLPASAGTACNPSAPQGAPPSTLCPNGNQKYRTNYPVNLGTITSSINVINIGVSFRF
jgi:long-chain fatty acid transport protein